MGIYVNGAAANHFKKVKMFERQGLLILLYIIEFNYLVGHKSNHFQ